ncbi:hypothetical protein GTV32_22740 [Gordonia sp. SID5947]|nr:hypothetical protein [Gordonia sp. SID5947]
MRRKSVTGRAAATFASGGYSLLASNNRGVLYVTVTGVDTGSRTYTTRNPSGALLTSVRALKAAADACQNRGTPPPAAASDDLTAQLTRLAELHASGALSDAEFADAKRHLLT